MQNIRKQQLSEKIHYFFLMIHFYYVRKVSVNKRLLTIQKIRFILPSLGLDLYICIRIQCSVQLESSDCFFLSLNQLPICTKGGNFNFCSLYAVSCAFPMHCSSPALNTDLLTETFSNSHQFKCISNFTGLICQVKGYYFHCTNAKLRPKEFFSQADFYFQRPE